MNAEYRSSSEILIFGSSDDVVFHVDTEVAMMSETIKNMIHLYCAVTVISIHNVTGEILFKVLDYCKIHIRANKTGMDLKAYDSEFVKVDHTTLKKLIMASSYLNISSLMELTTQAFANKIKDMSAEDVRLLLHIQNDFTPEGEAKVRKETVWTLE